MKPVGVLLVVLGSVFGMVTALALHRMHPAPPLQDLLAEHRVLQAELLRQEDELLPPVHEQWQTLKSYVALYQELSLTMVEGETHASHDHAVAGRGLWRGVLTGPARELILVSRSLQALAMVRFERLSIEQGKARLFLSLTGGPA